MNGAAMPVARLDDVTQRYGRAVALDHVSLVFPAGDMIGLIGPDGVGKSTLLEHSRRGAPRFNPDASTFSGATWRTSPHREAI